MRDVTVEVASRLLGESEGTVRGWLRRGAPVVRRGSKGRGRCTLVNVEALGQWRRAQTAEQQLLAVASDVPQIVIDAIADVARGLDGQPHKRDTIGSLSIAAHFVTTALFDRLRLEVPSLPKPPQQIEPAWVIFAEASNVVTTNDDIEDC